MTRTLLRSEKSLHIGTTFSNAQTKEKLSGLLAYERHRQRMLLQRRSRTLRFIRRLAALMLLITLTSAPVWFEDAFELCVFNLCTLCVPFTLLLFDVSLVTCLRDSLRLLTFALV